MTSPPARSDPAFHGRHVLIGMGGGIACYKLAFVVSQLVQSGAKVTVAMTESATQFITPLTFEALSGRPVYRSMWERIESHDPQHISLARSVDVMLIAPATMDLIARLAHGFADDVVTLLASAIEPTRTPMLIAPSMNASMLAQQSTQRNLAQLEADGFRIIEPTEGWQACRTEGKGRLAEPQTIVDAIASILQNR